MKKIFAFVLIIFSLVACLVSCNQSFFEEEHEHSHEWVTNNETHFKQYTCGCASPEIIGVHSDNNVDGYCDICNYPCGFFSEFVTSESVESIRLSYMVKINAITIEDEEIIEDLIAFIADAKGEKGESSKGYYGCHYALEIEFVDGSTLDFYLWDKNRYTSSKYIDEEGYQFFFNADMSEMYEYLEGKYPESFWYSEDTENTTTANTDDGQGV